MHDHTPNHDAAHVRLQIVSNPLLNSGAREMVASMAKRMGFADESAHQIALAVDEALCNVEHHGYRRDTTQPIWISLFAIGGLASSTGQQSPTTGIKVVIEDEARQVDPDSIKSRPLDEIRPGGLGVHIIREVMDQVIYEKRSASGKGMRLTMIKLKPAESAGTTPHAPQHPGAHP
jgi:serine/threonine-protein kinase RsbW